MSLILKCRYLLLPLFSMLSLKAIYGQPVNVGIPDIPIRSMKGDNLSTKQFNGKKVIYFVCEVNEINISKLKQLDSIVKANSQSMAAIVIPISDFSGNKKIDLKEWKKIEAATSFLLITDVGKAKRSNGTSQHSLLKWLSSKDLNGHYDFDFNKAGQIFMTNESGRMYACFMEEVDFSNIVFGRALRAVR
jgi:hypothetical protein